MSEDTVYKTKKISQNDLEKYYKVKLTKEEFEGAYRFGPARIASWPSKLPPWITMNIHGYPWMSMALHGCP